VAARDLLDVGHQPDGVDASLVELAPPRPTLINTAYLPLPAALTAELHALQTPGRNELTRAARAGNELSRLHAEAVLALLKTLDGGPGNVAAVTGAAGERVLGAIYPA